MVVIDEIEVGDVVDIGKLVNVKVKMDSVGFFNVIWDFYLINLIVWVFKVMVECLVFVKMWVVEVVE